MTVEISKLLNEMATFIKIVESRKSFVEDIMGKLKKNLTIIREQLEVYSLSRKASVSRNMLKKFPDVKQRLLSKLNFVIEEEIEEMTEHINRLSEFSEELRKMTIRMEKLMSQIKWKEHSHFFNAFSRIFQWTERCWKFFHLICMNVRNGLTVATIDDTHSSAHLKFTDTIDGINKEYVFNNPVIKMFQLLKIDVSSRSKISVKSSAVSRRSSRKDSSHTITHPEVI